MIPHAFIVRFWLEGQPIECQSFTGHDRRARARGFAMIKRAQGYQTIIQPIGY
jgi:hypothetical protein